MLKRFASLFIALIVTFVGVFVLGSPSASAVSQKCKDHSTRHVYKYVRAIPDNHLGQNTNPDYVQKAWHIGCERSWGYRVWRVGGLFNFPNGMNPCAADFTGTKVKFQYYPGGYKNSFIISCDADGFDREWHNVNVKIPEKLAPPQPDLARTYDVKAQITGMWGGGLNDNTRNWVNMFFYNR